MVKGEVSGRKTLASIEAALTDVSKEVDGLTEELAEANREKTALVAQRLEAFGDLAKLRTQLALVDGVVDEADQLSAQVRTILEARQKTIRILNKLREDAEAERSGLTKKQDALLETIEKLEKQLDAFGDKAKRALSGDPAYKAQIEAIKDLEQTSAKAAEKAAKSRTEEAAKGAPYRGDPLFMYLWDRGYGTYRYDKTGIIRALDDWVAGLIGFQDARANFAVLTQIPEKLSLHAKRLQEKLQTGRGEVDTLEADKIAELAGAEFLTELENTHRERDALLSALQKLDAEVIETGHQLRMYAEGGDASFKEAIGKMTLFLQSRELASLRREARATADVGDDEIVALIVRLSEERSELEEFAGDTREKLDAAFKRKQELMRIAADFRRSGYDEPGSVFEPGGGGKVLLDMLLKGAITAIEYWARTQGRQRWRGRSGDGYRRGRSFPAQGRSRRRSGSREPDFRTGGGF